MAKRNAKKKKTSVSDILNFAAGGFVDISKLTDYDYLSGLLETVERSGGAGKAAETIRKMTGGGTPEGGAQAPRRRTRKRTRKPHGGADYGMRTEGKEKPEWSSEFSDEERGRSRSGAGKAARKKKDDEDNKRAEEFRRKIVALLIELTIGNKGMMFANLFGFASKAAGGGGGGVPPIDAFNALKDAMGGIPPQFKALGAALTGAKVAAEALKKTFENFQERTDKDAQAVAAGVDTATFRTAEAVMKGAGGKASDMYGMMQDFTLRRTRLTRAGDSAGLSEWITKAETLLADRSDPNDVAKVREFMRNFLQKSGSDYFKLVFDQYSKAHHSGQTARAATIAKDFGLGAGVMNLAQAQPGLTGERLLSGIASVSQFAGAGEAANRRARIEANIGKEIIKQGLSDIKAGFFDYISLMDGEGFTEQLKNVKSIPKKAKGGRETRPALFAEAGPEWFIPEKNDANSHALIIQAAEACGLPMFARGGRRSFGRKADKSFLGPKIGLERRTFGRKAPKDFLGKRIDLGRRTTLDYTGSVWRGKTTKQISDRIAAEKKAAAGKQVTINISHMEVKANDAQAFMKSLQDIAANPFSGVATSLAASFDTKRVV